MKIQIVTPDSSTSTKGNFITAKWWARICKRLGHRTRVCSAAGLQFDWNADLLIALHAVKTSAAVGAFRDRFSNRPIVVVLTGTDVYSGRAAWRETARQTMEMADRLVTLQDATSAALPARLRLKTSIVMQSVDYIPSVPAATLKRVFEVCVVGHLRKEKDPFRVAMAARMLPAESRIRVHHYGAALSDSFEREAMRLSDSESRYHWFGQYPRWKTLQRIARSNALVQPSRSEGGAGTLSEAIALGTPIIASRIPGNVGIVGEKYPGLFECGATRQLRDMLWQFETNEGFRRDLSRAIKKLCERVSPQAEEEAIRALLESVCG